MAANRRPGPINATLRRRPSARGSSVQAVNITALHRAAGEGPGPITDELLDAAITAGATESDDLDWKQALPRDRDLKDSDFTKDVAAMANNRGGVIVYGVSEDQKAATGRQAIRFSNDFEHTERTMRAVACTAITPPILGLDIIPLGSGDDQAVTVVVPDSPDGPHLIFRQDLFAAPFRNGADTLWASEHQIEAMYRARFEERRHATEALDRIYAEAAAGHDTSTRAWFIGAAHPRIPELLSKRSRDEAREIFTEASRIGQNWTLPTFQHPLDNVECSNPRPGLRRWIAPNMATGGHWDSKDSQAAVHHDGSVSVATAIGAEPTGRDTGHEGWQIWETSLEHAVVDLIALVKEASKATGTGEYEIRVGLAWEGDHPLEVVPGQPGHFMSYAAPIPLPSFLPVEMTIDASENTADFHQHLYDLVTDVINQGGISEPTVIQPPSPEGQE